MIDLFGHTASVIILISLLMSSMKKLRIYNCIGALCFAIYGILIKSTPVAILNFSIVIIDLYYIYQIFRKKDNYKP